MATVNKLMIYVEETNILDISETTTEYSLGNIAQSSRYKGKFFISNIDNNVFFAQRIPNNVAEDEYIREFLETHGDTGIGVPMMNFFNDAGEHVVPVAVKNDDHTILHLPKALEFTQADAQKLSNEYAEDRASSLLSEVEENFYNTIEDEEITTKN